MSTLSENAKFLRLSGAIAAATTDATSITSVDMRGFSGLTLLVSAAAITSGALTVVKLHQSDDDGSTDAYSDIEGSALSIADDSDGKLTVVEMVDPQKRYVKPVITRGTQNAAFEAVLAVQTGPKTAPVTQSTSHVAASELHHAPAEGTA